jgi:Mycothiol maleylpyruvate isomerase N-terminal domain
MCFEFVQHFGNARPIGVDKTYAHQRMEPVSIVLRASKEVLATQYCDQMDFAELYRSSHGRVDERVARLAPAQLAATVPGTPLWSVADLVAHVTGVASDALHRRLAAAGAPEWTAAQVGQRTGRPIAEVLDEWR